MSLLTREASSEARQHGEPSIVPCPTVKSATSAFYMPSARHAESSPFAPLPGRGRQECITGQHSGHVRPPDYAIGASRTPAASAPIRRCWSHTAKRVSAAPTASRLARCTASAARSACRLAR